MSFEELLKSLQAEYLAALPKKIETILHQIQDAALNELRESFHKLKGTGTTYGLPEVTELAELLEDICTDLPEKAPEAARRATEILLGICDARTRDQAFDLRADPRYADVRGLLARG